MSLQAFLVRHNVICNRCKKRKVFKYPDGRTTKICSTCILKALNESVKDVALNCDAEEKK